MAKIIVVAGRKGGSGKTTISLAIAHGLALLGVPAYHLSTDQGREILPAENRRFATLDGREPKKLAALVDRLARVERAVAIIDGGGNRPEFDKVLASVADATFIPFMHSEQDLKVARGDLDRIPEALGLPNRWPTQTWARKVADASLQAELRDYKARLMSRMPEINALGTLLREEGASPKIGIGCKNLALRVLDRMNLSLHDFTTEEEGVLAS